MTHYTEEELQDAFRRNPDLKAPVKEGHELYGVDRAGWSERFFSGQFVRVLNQRGYRHYHTHDSRKSDAGFPDWVIWHPEQPGRIIIAELKTQDGIVTFEQDLVLNAFRANGHIEVYVWRPADWETIMKILI